MIQVFLNLLDNALKHSPVEGEIVVSLDSDCCKLEESREDEVSSIEPQVIIDIVDSGTGFVSSDIPHVFERLYRGERSRNRKASDLSGSGLGLAIVQEIIQAHGGFIEAKNHPDLGGAWLRVKLPCDPKNPI